MKPWLTAVREHALDVRWCSRHQPHTPYRRYRGGRRRCHQCGYLLPWAGSKVFDQLLRENYGPRLIRLLQQATPLLDYFT